VVDASDPRRHRNGDTEELLEDVTRRVRLGLYSDDLVRQVEDLCDRFIGNHTQGDESLEQLRVRSLAAEVYDQVGEFAKVKAILQDTPQRLLIEFQLLRTREQVFPPALQRDPIKFSQKQRLLRQKMWVVLAYAFALYRDHALDRTIQVLQSCERVLDDILRDQRFQCLGTGARLQYCRGMALGSISDSEEAFEQAIVLTFKRLKDHIATLKRTPPSEDDSFSNEQVNLSLRTEQAFANHFVGRVLLSFARSCHLNGELHRARQMLNCSAIVLSDNENEFLKQDVQLRLGTVHRKLAGRRGPNLDEAMRYLEDCYHFFRTKGHRTQLARAAYEFGSAHLSFAQGLRTDPAGDTPGPRYEQSMRLAEDLAGHVLKASEETGASAWYSSGLVLMSRISNERQDCGTALAHSNRALTSAKKSGSQAAVAQALIARGQSYVGLSRFNEAADSFEEAARLGKEHHVLLVSGTLHAAQAYLHMQRLDPAQRLYASWQHMKGRVEHKILLDLAEDVSRKIAALQGSFLIPGGVESLEFDRHRDRLQEFLYQLALDRAGPDIDEMAGLLGVSRSTVYKWKQAYDSPRLGRRRSKPT
jgi:tetratricopeptide (TPR) repeat protein